MKYTVITKTGKVMCFYVKAVADMYLVINGGVLCEDNILETTDGVKNEFA
jgi:hypothetical protein